MKRFLLILTTVLTLAVMATAQTVTERVDLADNKSPVFSTYCQGLPGGLEMWVLGANTPTPTTRFGVVRPISPNVKLGCYLSRKGEQKWINPRLVMTGQHGKTRTLVVVDGYLGSDRRLSLSDAYIVQRVSKRTEVGLGANFLKIENKPCQVKGAVVLTQQISATNKIFVRWNCFGAGPSDLRLEISHKM